MFGSILVTIYGLKELGRWSELRVVLDSEIFNLWKPLAPADGNITRAPELVKENGKMVSGAWHFNDNYPWLGMLFCAPIIGPW